jgi:hypothetical protein
VDRPLDWMDLARLFEPEAEERADVSAALRKGFLRLKEPLRSPVPPPFLSPRRIFLSWETTKKSVLDENLCTCRNEHLEAFAHERPGGKGGPQAPEPAWRYGLPACSGLLSTTMGAATRRG